MSALSCDDLLTHAVEQFQRHFGRPAKYAAAAPGRVNLIGEHTDYNGGFVLPIAIDRQTVIVADRGVGRTVRLLTLPDEAEGEEDIATFDISPRLGPDDPEWSNYVRGVLVGCMEHQITIPGFDALICSTVPIGAGLSSSAALEVATATLVEAICNQRLDPVDKALLCQAAEHQFANVPCGIMDQFVSTSARDGHALLLDCKSLKADHAPINSEQVSVVVVNSNVRHELSNSEYPVRRQQCEAAAKTLGIDSLRSLSVEAFERRKGELDQITVKRVRHVVTEIARTRQAADALGKDDWKQFGDLMCQSHASLRDDYTVSCSELDLLVELAMQQSGVFGARMTGGGFGGCIVALAQADNAAAAMERVVESYTGQTGIPADGFVTSASTGTQILSVS